jgi:hypothetical protein
MCIYMHIKRLPLSRRVPATTISVLVSITALKGLHEPPWKLHSMRTQHFGAAFWNRLVSLTRDVELSHIHWNTRRLNCRVVASCTRSIFGESCKFHWNREVLVTMSRNLLVKSACSLLVVRHVTAGGEGANRRNAFLRDDLQGRRCIKARAPRHPTKAPCVSSRRLRHGLTVGSDGSRRIQVHTGISRAALPSPESHVRISPAPPAPADGAPGVSTNRTAACLSIGLCKAAAICFNRWPDEPLRGC